MGALAASGLGGTGYVLLVSTRIRCLLQAAMDAIKTDKASVLGLSNLYSICIYSISEPFPATSLPKSYRPPRSQTYNHSFFSSASPSFFSSAGLASSSSTLLRLSMVNHKLLPAPSSALVRPIPALCNRYTNCARSESRPPSIPPTHLTPSTSNTLPSTRPPTSSNFCSAFCTSGSQYPGFFLLVGAGKAGA